MIYLGAFYFSTLVAPVPITWKTLAVIALIQEVVMIMFVVIMTNLKTRY